jgi:xylan 1,4-beta-xylosidase
VPSVEVPAPDLPAHPWPAEPARDDFDSPELGIHFQTLRVPADESWLSLSERPGWLRLRGRESLASRHDQSLVARRVQGFEVEAATCLEFDPEDFQQMAGLVCYYDTSKHYYLHVSRDEQLGKCLGIIACNSGEHEEPLSERISVDGWPHVWLKAELRRSELRFFFSRDGRDWQPAGGALDATRLSDEYPGEGSFTGAFVGLAAQDLSGRRLHADFDFFEYRTHS